MLMGNRLSNGLQQEQTREMFKYYKQIEDKSKNRVSYHQHKQQVNIQNNEERREKEQIILSYFKLLHFTNKKE